MHENVIEFFKDQETATVTLSQGRYISKIRRFAKEYPEECEIIAENKDGSILAHIQTKWIKISPPRQISDEQRQKLSDAARQNFGHVGQYRAENGKSER